MLKHVSAMTAIILLSASFMSVEAKTTDLQQHIQQLSPVVAEHEKSVDPLTRYHAYKAKMWLSYANNEQSERSLTVAGQEAVAHAQVLVAGLDQPQTLSLTTPILTVSQAMRRDLWAQIEYFKQQGAINVAPERLAQAEVGLVWAAAEYCELGWRHAREHFLAVERQLYQVQQLMPQLKPFNITAVALPTIEQLNGQACHGVNTAYWPILSTTSAEVEKVTPIQALNVENVVHFALDQAALNAEGKAVLNEIVRVLHVHPELNITLMGHTDLRASAAYNLRLSQRRIDTVRNYLVAQGITVDRIAEQAKGKTQLIGDVEQRMAHAKSRRVEVYFHDVDGIHIQVQPQWRDLQPEPVKQ